MKRIDRLTLSLINMSVLAVALFLVMVLNVAVLVKFPIEAAMVVSAVFAIPIGFFTYKNQRAVADRHRLGVQESPADRLRYRVEAVNRAFADSVELMDELRRDLEAQQVVRDELIAQSEVHRELLALDPERADKIRRILVGETKATIRAERRQQWLFFALGLLASIPIGVAINLLVP